MSLPEDRYELTGRRTRKSEELLTRLNELIHIWKGFKKYLMQELRWNWNRHLYRETSKLSIIKNYKLTIISVVF